MPNDISYASDTVQILDSFPDLAMYSLHDQVDLIIVREVAVHLRHYDDIWIQQFVCLDQIAAFLDCDVNVLDDKL